MGYYVDMTEADFTIPESKEVLAALREMPVKYQSLKRSGTHFAWMSDEEIENAETVQSVFESLGFDCRDYGNGTFGLDSYNDKTGQEDLFLAVVAPFVENGSYTQWRGEDGELYRYTVYRGKLTVQTPREIQWNDHETLRIMGFEKGSLKPVYTDPYSIKEVTNA